jgi:predicted amidohydrolase YtcJ
MHLTISSLQNTCFLLGISCFLFGQSSCAEADALPDLIIYNASIYTVNTTVPNAEAISIINGKIISVGSSAQILASQDTSTQLIDAKGMFVMPGFIEGHGHFPGLGASLQNLNFLNVTAWDEVIAMVAAKVADSEPGEWITGRGWHQEKWLEIPEHNVQGYPYHHDLSAVSPNNPVMLRHASGHALFANKAAMALAGVHRETSDPVGGHVVRGDGGEAIGVFEENAQQIIGDIYRTYLTTLSEQQLLDKWYEGARLAQDLCLKNGITSFQDAGSSLEEVRRFKTMAEKGALDIRIWMMVRHTSEFLDGKLAGFPMIGIGQDFFTSRALKVSIDGALGSYGAWLLKPYDDRDDFTGQNTTTIDEVRILSELCYEKGLQMCTHAIGDRANREVLNIYEEIIGDVDAADCPRWRIEHAQHLDPADIPRFKSLGVVASMQGIHCTSDAPYVERRLGVERARNGAYVWRSLLDAGAVVANGTDAPVEDINPILSPLPHKELQ